MATGADFTGNNELALHVADPTAASAFYVDVMGCRLVDSDPHCFELENGALRLFLLLDPSADARTTCPVLQRGGPGRGSGRSGEGRVHAGSDRPACSW